MRFFSTNIQSGFILVTVLFFLLMIALMILSLLNITHLELRLSRNYTMVSQQFWAAEAGLKMAENKLAHLLEGINFQDEFNYAGYQVQYNAKRFSLPFCSDQHIVYYYRITAKAKQAPRNVLVLQTTYAKKTNKKCESNEVQRLTEGRSAWRELNTH